MFADSVLCGLSPLKATKLHKHTWREEVGQEVGVAAAHLMRFTHWLIDWKKTIKNSPKVSHSLSDI